MNRFLAKYFFFYPVRFMRKEKVHTFLNQVRAIESMNEEELDFYQWSKLKNVLLNAHTMIPYYRDLINKSSFSLDDIKEQKDLTLIPCLTKDIIRREGKNLRNPLVNTLDKRSTSGSTGEPLIFFKDRLASAYMDAVMYHTYSWHGINIGDRQSRFWGMPNDKRKNQEAKVKDFLMNRVRLSAFDLDDKSLLKFYRKMVSFRPDYFYGYPSLIYQFALFLEKNKIKPIFSGLKSIVVTGEVLFENQKNKIEKIFNCPVVNEYGCSEIGIIGFECKQRGMHVMSHNIYIEVIKDEKHVYDEEGEIFLTELNSLSHSFVRYKNGDRGILLTRKCPCGCHFPLVEVTSGRIDDYIVTPDGRKVYDAILAYTFKKGIESFRAIQEKTSELIVYIKVNSEFTPILENKYKKMLHNKLGDEIKINFIFVDEIKKEKSGKMRYFKSELKQYR